MKVQLKNRITRDNRIISTLSENKLYIVIGIEADDYRILDDNNEPVIFDNTCFEVIDAAEPGFWEYKFGTTGERYCYPKEFAQPGFFEDYFDGISNVRAFFWNTYHSLYESNNPMGI